MEQFKKLGIIAPILRVIEEEKFEHPSEIQEKSIPLVVSGKDVIAGSATGSGKTLVFGSAIIQQVDTGKGIQSLILTPTRELALQVALALKTFSKYKHLNIIAVYGGVAIGPQIDGLRRADVVVGTPGRILDHLSRRTLNLSKIKVLVLDEADRMFDMGFREDVEEIISHCSPQRQTLLFSATISSDIANLSRKYMNQPVEIFAESYVDPKKLTQIYYDVQQKLKFSLLVHLLKKEKTPGLSMVFCNTQSTTNFVERNLKSLGINALAIHGGFSQAKREMVIKKFYTQKVDVLVCTDVAARGLDIKGVSHVYNYDIPKDSKQYIHRIGRTARAGSEGKAVNLLSSRDHDNFTRVLRENQMDITLEKTPYVERLEVTMEERDNSSPREGNRGRGGSGSWGRRPRSRRF